MDRPLPCPGGWEAWGSISLSGDSTSSAEQNAGEIWVDLHFSFSPGIPNHPLLGGHRADCWAEIPTVLWAAPHNRTSLGTLQSLAGACRRAPLPHGHRPRPGCRDGPCVNTLRPHVRTSELPPALQRHRAQRAQRPAVPLGRAGREAGVSLLAVRRQTRRRPCGWARRGEAAPAEARGVH